MKSYTKVNSFTNSPSSTQIISYIINILQPVVFYVLIQSNFNSTVTQITLLCLFSIFQLVKIVLTLIISFGDPADEAMIKIKSQNKEDLNKYVSENMNEFLYCGECKSYVKKLSKHCRVCDRCVEEFDHHCIWLNNCVGSKNYKLFISLIYVFEIDLTIFLISGSLLWNEGRWENYLVEMIFVWIMMVILTIFWLLNLSLIIFHMFLIRKGTTTYDFLYSKPKNKIIPIEIQRTEEDLSQSSITNTNKSVEPNVISMTMKERPNIELSKKQYQTQVVRSSGSNKRENIIRKVKSFQSIFSDTNIFQPQ